MAVHYKGYTIEVRDVQEVVLIHQESKQCKIAHFDTVPEVEAWIDEQTKDPAVSVDWLCESEGE